MPTDTDAPPHAATAAPADSVIADVASAAGYVLAVSYPVLALSTGVRAGYQLLFKQGGLLFAGALAPVIGPLTSATAAGLYLIASIGFAVRRRWAWRLSVATLGLETLLTLVVGTLSLPPLYGELIGSSVWRLYGIDYGFFPLFQPLLGLLWLFWPVTTRRYGIAPGRSLAGLYGARGEEVGA